MCSITDHGWREHIARYCELPRRIQKYRYAIKRYYDTIDPYSLYVPGTDPGVTINIYQTLPSYTVPGKFSFEIGLVLPAFAALTPYHTHS